MGRIRTIKPEFWANETLSELPEATHLLAASLLNHSDDEGYFNANPGLVRAACSPLREPSVSIHVSLAQLSNAGYLRLGSTPDGRRYGCVVKFSEHQRVNRPTPSKIKELPIVWDDSVITHGALTAPSLLEGKGKEGNREQGKEGNALRAVPHETPVEWFLNFKLAYPERAGDPGWRAATKAANARMAEGHTVDEFIEGAKRYALYIAATGNAGTEYVKKASTFLGPDKPFLLPWNPPATKADARLAGNLSAADEFMRRTDAAQ